MKTESELNNDILKITTTIRKDFPELLKYLNEMPVNIHTADKPGISLKALTDYYNSLEALVADYALSHNTEGR